MTLQEIHAELKRLVPAAGTIYVTHQISNNSVGEVWSAQFYVKENDDLGLTNCMFIIHLQKSPESLITEAIRLNKEYDPEAKRIEEIAKLRKKLAALENE